MTLKFTLLKIEDLIGRDAIDGIKGYTDPVLATDLAVILGGGYEQDIYTYFAPAASWTRSISTSSIAPSRPIVHRGEGKSSWDCSYPATGNRTICIRPALPPEETAKILPPEKSSSEDIKIDTIGYRRTFFGEYPQFIAPKKIAERLEREFQAGELKTTGKTYTFDAIDSNDRESEFQPKQYDEYYDYGDKYIRVLGRPSDSCVHLSNNERVEKGKPYWIRVSPIEWLVGRDGTWVTKSPLISGIPYDMNYKGNFEESFIKHYLDTYFSKEVKLPRIKEQVKKQEKEDKKGFSDLLTKAKALDRASAKERRQRETLVKMADEAGIPLSKEEVKKLRDKEERARLKVAKRFLKKERG